MRSYNSEYVGELAQVAAIQIGHETCDRLAALMDHEVTVEDDVEWEEARERTWTHKRRVEIAAVILLEVFL